MHNSVSFCNTLPYCLVMFLGKTCAFNPFCVCYSVHWALGTTWGIWSKLVQKRAKTGDWVRNSFRTYLLHTSLDWANSCVVGSETFWTSKWTSQSHHLIQPSPVRKPKKLFIMLTCRWAHCMLGHGELGMSYWFLDGSLVMLTWRWAMAAGGIYWWSAATNSDFLIQVLYALAILNSDIPFPSPYKYHFHSTFKTHKKSWDSQPHNHSSLQPFSNTSP